MLTHSLCVWVRRSWLVTTDKSSYHPCAHFMDGATEAQKGEGTGYDALSPTLLAVTDLALLPLAHSWTCLGQLAESQQHELSCPREHSGRGGQGPSPPQRCLHVREMEVEVKYKPPAQLQHTEGSGPVCSGALAPF